MRVYLILIFFIFAGSTYALSLTEDLNQWLEGEWLLEGRFVQKNTYSDTRAEETYRGEFLLHRPGQIRWQYIDGTKDVVVIGEEGVILYQPEYNQAFIYRKGELPGGLPLWLLTDRVPLQKGFTIQEEGSTLLLTPRAETSVKWIKLILQPEREELPIRKIEVQDLYGNRIQIEITSVRTVKGFGNDPFKLRLPEGTTIIKEPPL